MRGLILPGAIHSAFNSFFLIPSTYPWLTLYSTYILFRDRCDDDAIDDDCQGFFDGWPWYLWCMVFVGWPMLAILLAERVKTKDRYNVKRRDTFLRYVNRIICYTASNHHMRLPSLGNYLKQG